MANVRLYALRHERPLTTKAVANFTRSELATALRKVCCPSLLRNKAQLLILVSILEPSCFVENCVLCLSHPGS